MKQEELSPEEAAEWEAAQKKFRARMRGMTIFCLMLAAPIAVGAYLVWRVQAHLGADQAWAEAELKKPNPDRLAYGSLGSIYLNQKRVAEALPLLKTAAAFEGKAKNSAEAHFLYVEAEIEAQNSGLPGASRSEALGTLKDVLSYADSMPQGPRAAAWHGAGKLYQYMGLTNEAQVCLKEAWVLQPDDWVDEGQGHRFKDQGIASTYQKDYSATVYP